MQGKESMEQLRGTVADTEKYIEEMKKDALFDGMQFKRSRGTGTAFPKLSVKVRPEVVTTKVEGLGTSVRINLSSFSISLLRGSINFSIYSSGVLAIVVLNMFTP